MKIWVINEQLTGRNLLVSASSIDEALTKGRAWFTDDKLLEDMNYFNDSMARMQMDMQKCVNSAIKENAWAEEQNARAGHEVFAVRKVPQFPAYTPYTLEEFKSELNVYVEEELDFSTTGVIEINELST